MFDDHFEVFLADTRESKEIHYSIRYQVYCEEMGFENKHWLNETTLKFRSLKHLADGNRTSCCRLPEPRSKT